MDTKLSDALIEAMGRSDSDPPLRLGVVIWQMTPGQADTILNALMKRFVDAYTALYNEPTTREWNEKINKLHDRMQEALKDLVDGYHVAETIAHCIDEMPAEVA